MPQLSKKSLIYQHIDFQLKKEYFRGGVKKELDLKFFVFIFAIVWDTSLNKEKYRIKGILVNASKTKRKTKLIDKPEAKPGLPGLCRGGRLLLKTNEKILL